MTGLRLQIVLALAGVILVLYVPLFFAIAQITRGTSMLYREDAARSLGRAVAAHVSDVRTTSPDVLDRTLAAHVGEGGALAIAVFGPGGAPIAKVGESLAAPPSPYGESVRARASGGARILDVAMPSGTDAVVVVRVRAEDDPARTGQLVRAVALYMSVFALALLVFAYTALTRVIVRPIERLARAADKVATGARTLEVPSSGAREVAQLAASVRAMEQALRTKIDELTTTTRRLGETREQLTSSERLASVGRLAAGVAHEIGNPLAAIMGMHDLLDDTETSDETRSDFLRRMRSETERIHVVVRDLLDYARPEAIGAAAADVRSVVDDTWKLVRPQKDFKGIELALDVADERVALGPQRLTQVILNLLLNAGAAMAGQGTITVRARRDGPRVRIEVEDDGPGVPEGVAPRIFDPFVTTKDVGSGTGLGLAVCRGIVEGAHGTIALDETHRPGARFVIELPAAS